PAPEERPITKLILSANRKSVASGEEVTFAISVEPSYSDLEYRVIFGDTQEEILSGTHPRTAHVYKNKGQYDVTAFVRTPNGVKSISSNTVSIAVTAAEGLVSTQTLVGGAFLLVIAGTGLYRYLRKRPPSLGDTKPTGPEVSTKLSFDGNKNFETAHFRITEPVDLNWQLDFMLVRSSGRHTVLTGDDL